MFQERAGYCRETSLGSRGSLLPEKQGLDWQNAEEVASKTDKLVRQGAVTV